ncbi:MAG TPA: FGGY family carbohydrate kinase [Povalibacter sp.]|nr:FGGY family carbohydrate kinase [Povalibacter sp.]
MQLIAIIDIGKTNAKLVLVESQSGREVFQAKRSNTSRETALGRQLDIAGIEQWLLEALRSTPLTAQVAAIVPIAHGATAVLIDGHGAVVAAPDYEDPRFETINADYERERDAFAATFSPSLPLGLNLARQLYYLQVRAPDVSARTAHILLYPQYWAWRFSGVLASEVTSLGCHTDLWRPREATFSQLAHSHGWSRTFPALRQARETLGTITPQIAAATGLNPDCRVVCGIHDSNASYLEHLLDRSREQPFAVISSGTWTIVMANRGNLTRLREERDMLANVDAFGAPVATARFMGGREYEAIARTTVRPDIAALESVVQQSGYALPSFADAGPFPAARGVLLGAERFNEAERAALATLYAALMSDLLLESLEASGDVLIDGPLAANPLFAPLLAAWHPQAQVFGNAGAGGVCARAARYLAGFDTAPAISGPAPPPLNVPHLDAYRQTWRAQLPR